MVCLHMKQSCHESLMRRCKGWKNEETMDVRVRSMKIGSVDFGKLVDKKFNS